MINPDLIPVLRNAFSSRPLTEGYDASHSGVCINRHDKKVVRALFESRMNEIDQARRAGLIDAQGNLTAAGTTELAAVGGDLRVRAAA